MLKNLAIFFLILCAANQGYAQKDSLSKDPITDISTDYEALFSELDSFLDSLLRPRSFAIVSVNASSNFFDHVAAGSSNLQTLRQMVLSPAVGYYNKSGLGISASGNILKEQQGFNAYQLATTLSYDYLKNFDFIGGIAATHYFTKDTLSFYTSPLQNELYGYFTYRKSWVKPALAVSYGWGSRTSIEERETHIVKLRKRKNPTSSTSTIETEESVRDLNVAVSVRHDFFWLNVLGAKTFARLTPQLSFTSGTQSFGFNQTTSMHRSNLLTGKTQLQQTENTNLDGYSKFQPLFAAAILKSELSLGKFFVQPQVMLNYFIPGTENQLSTILSVNTGFIF
ncbi:MAG TPA: hypothetical protein VEZ55_17815 [Chitinophagaceae bacterium]|nr:hypothetical protein [Chitinophagaceae bacterium]